MDDVEAIVLVVNAAYILEDLKFEGQNRIGCEEVRRILGAPNENLYVLTVDRQTALEAQRQSPRQWTGTAFGTEVTLPDELLLPEDGDTAAPLVIGSVYHKEVSEGIGYMGILAVHPTQVGKGFGRSLMDHVEQEARRQGQKRVRLCYIDVNERNAKMYGRRGYKPTGEHGWVEKIGRERFEQLIRPEARNSKFIDAEMVL